MRTIHFKSGELLVIVTVDIEDWHGTREFRRRVHQRRRYGNDSTYVL